MLPGMSAIPAPLPVARPVTLLVIHGSATPGGQPLADGHAGATAADVIDRWHGARGIQRTVWARSAWRWPLAHIGYHWVIDLHGQLLEGRPPGEAGAHASGHNAHSLGICLVGGAERDARYTPAQWAALRRLVLEQCAAFGIKPRFPLYPAKGGGVCGHRDLLPAAAGAAGCTTHCPGFDVGWWLANGLQPAPEHVLTERVA